MGHTKESAPDARSSDRRRHSHANRTRGEGIAEERSRRRSRGDSAARSSARDRKSTRLNSSHQIISYAVFCLKKKNNLIATSEIIATAISSSVNDSHY